MVWQNAKYSSCQEGGGLCVIVNSVPWPDGSRTSRAQEPHPASLVLVVRSLWFIDGSSGYELLRQRLGLPGSVPLACAKGRRPESSSRSWTPGASTGRRREGQRPVGCGLHACCRPQLAGPPAPSGGNRNVQYSERSVQSDGGFFAVFLCRVYNVRQSNGRYLSGDRLSGGVIVWTSSTTSVRATISPRR